MKTFALKTRKRSVVKTMCSKSAKQQKALEQARSKLEDLTRKDVRVVFIHLVRGRSGAVRRRTVDRRHDELVRGVWDDRGGPEDSNARSSPPSPKHKADQNREASRRL